MTDAIGTLFSLADRRALVTGASRGIGRAIATLFACAGADVAIHYHRRNDLAETLATEIRGLGRRAAVLQADLSARGAGMALAANARAALGGVDILVLNAAEQRREPHGSVGDANYDLQIGTGFRSAFELAQALLPEMRARGFGRVIAIGSVQQYRPNPELTVYAAMKAALANLMRNLAKPSGPDGVTCNTILPGLIATDRSAEVHFDQAAYARLIERIPARREGEPEEVAALALYLASPMGGYATGAEFAVDGGLVLP